MASPDALLRSIDAFGQQRTSIVDRVVTAVTGLFVSFEDWTVPDAITAVTSRSGVYVASGQRLVAGLTDAYLARSTSIVRGQPVSPVGVAPDMSGVLRNGVDSYVKVYSRLPAEYRWQRFLGKSKDEALQIVLNRAREMAAGDLDLAHQRQVSRFTRERRVAQYRRVVRPELSKTGTCGLCIAAADQIYHSGELMPIHDRCNCAVIEVAGGDPGSSINDDAISEAYKRAVNQAGSTRGADLKRVRFKVIEHGEMGPQLRVAGQNVRTAADVARSTGRTAGQDSEFWTRPNIERQLEMAHRAPNREWGERQAARYQQWLDEH